MNSIILAAIDGTFAIKQLLVLIVVGIILGLLHYLVGLAPFIPAIFKTILQWLIILVGVLVLINFLLALIGHPLINI